MANVVIAGGSGFLGKLLSDQLEERGHQVLILTRNPQYSKDIYWNPAKKALNTDRLGDCEIIINLCGAGIANGRWTPSRKEILRQSRLEPTHFLFSKREEFPKLQKYISASGINCYPLDHGAVYDETHAYGHDFVSHLVRDWEEAAKQFSRDVPVFTVRMAPVLHSSDGLMQRILPIVNWGLASPLGSGKQPMPWVHFEDVVSFYIHLIEHEVAPGPYNLCGEIVTNSTWMKTLAKVYRKPYFMLPVPGFVLRLLFGEMAQLFLEGVKADNHHSKATGFQYRFNELKEALEDLAA